MSELRTLRQHVAEREAWLHGFEKVVRLLQEDARNLEALEETDEILEAAEAASIALSNADLVRHRVKEELELLYSQIRAAEQADDARRLLASVRAATAALEAATV